MGENCDNFITSAIGSGVGGGGSSINSACSLVMNGSLAESTSSAHNTHSLSPIAHISSSPNSSSSNQPQQFSADYLSQLLKDKKQLTAFPNIFMHMERLVDEEISKVRLTLFRLDTNKEALVLPDPDGNVVVVQEKVYVPVKEFPDYNFVGRILGPRGMTAKQLEQETGCKIMVRGKGSMRDKNKEEISRGKPNWEHLNDELHVLIQCEDTENRAKVKLQRAVEDIKRLLVPAAEGEDELKRKQLMELAIINGTYRPASQSKIALQTPRLLTPMTLTSPLRSPTLGAPIILSPTRLANITSSPSSLANSLAAVSPFLQGAGADFSAAAGLLYNYSLDSFAGLAAAYPFGNASFASPLMAAGDYQSLDPQAGAILTQRKLLGKATRDHPYQRASSIRTPTNL